ncbi:MAG: transcriptional regulator, GntR family protein [Anaerosporomusa subterranea]|nr:transcriptional regulator, GntR family protein [Anaerosporomusa subterranea]
MSEVVSSAGKTSLSDLAHNTLKNMLLNLEIRPGSPITEIQLMETLGMSRTPIRQALHRLEQEGFVNLTPRKGWFVADISLRDIQEIFVVREALEGIAARLAAESITDDVLRELNEYMVKVSSAAAPDEQEAVDPGDILHDQIFAAVDNKQMNRVLGLYGDHLRRFHIMAIRLPGRALLSYQEHCEILQALTKRDGEGAEQAMRNHIRSSKRSLFEAIVNERVVW